MKTTYDQATDSLYIELRPAAAVRTAEVQPDVMVDYGADGEPVGYDIQRASTKRDLVARLVLGDVLPAA